VQGSDALLTPLAAQFEHYFLECSSA